MRLDVAVYNMEVSRKPSSIKLFSCHESGSEPTRRPRWRVIAVLPPGVPLGVCGPLTVPAPAPANFATNLPDSASFTEAHGVSRPEGTSQWLAISGKRLFLPGYRAVALTHSLPRLWSTSRERQAPGQPEPGSPRRHPLEWACLEGSLKEARRDISRTILSGPWRLFLFRIHIFMIVG